MRTPSENLRSSESTFHSTSVGGRLVGLLKKTSYSIFRRRNWVSSTFNSSSVVTKGLQVNSVMRRSTDGEVPGGHRSSWYESKKGSFWLLDSLFRVRRFRSGTGRERRE